MDTPQTQPPIPPLLNDMNRTLVWILEVLKTQGLSFLLLGIAVWYLQGQNNELRREISLCNEDKYNGMLEVLRQNTIALKLLKIQGDEQEERSQGWK